LSRSRRFSGQRLLVATHNRGKLNELTRLLAPHGIAVIGATELELAEPEETGASFSANARIKAIAASGAAGLPALADDSGLEVVGLDGRPGVHTARWAGPERDFTAAMRRVRDELAARFGSFAAADKRAAFVCALCLAWPDGHLEEVEARTTGMIAPEPRGEHGFGYDPLFIPDGEARTFGQMLHEEKAALSHRAKAVALLLERCFAPA
jgi:XTP/dITP diphosphohydrolase